MILHFLLIVVLHWLTPVTCPPGILCPPSPPSLTIPYLISSKICMSRESVLMKVKYKRVARRGEREKVINSKGNK
jgi:hypothetical protein